MHKFLHNSYRLMLLAMITLVAGLTSFYRAPSLHVLNIENPQQLKAFFHYTKDRIPFVSAHRGGARKGYPENCLATNFEDAKRCYALDENIMMEVFIPDKEAALRFEETGIPWENVVAFVTHQQPKDKTVCQYIHERGAMCIIGSSRTIDKAYLEEKINRDELEKGYSEIIYTGADIIEADLGIEAGKTLQEMSRDEESSKKRFFRK